MSDEPSRPPGTAGAVDDADALLDRALKVAIRIGLVGLLAVWCFDIVRPFITPIVWGVIIAVASYPGYLRLRGLSGGRGGLAAALFVLLAFLLIVLPAVVLSDTLVAGVRYLANDLRDGSLEIPPPPPGVAGWPLVGEPVARFWTLASENLGAALHQLEPQLRSLSLWLVSAVAGVGLALAQFVFAIVIAALFMVHAGTGRRLSRSIEWRLSGDRATGYGALAEATVRSVARGVLGVSLIQSLLAGLGFLAVGIPGAGLWALLCLILGIIQIGPLLVLVPVVVYVFATSGTAVAVVYLIWSVFVGVIDNVLKPLLLGRGVNVPMVVIFVGTLGGFLSMGIIGLFVGSTILVLGYTLFGAWLAGAGAELADPDVSQVP